METETPQGSTQADQSRRPFTVRGLMVYVALAGLLLGGSVLWSRSAACRAAAAFHAEQEFDSIESAQFYHDGALACSWGIRRSIEEIHKLSKELEGEIALTPGIDQGFALRLQATEVELREMGREWLQRLLESLSDDRDRLAWAIRRSAYMEKLAAHHAALKRKYQRAAIFPWMRVDAEPPGPRVDDEEL